MRRSVAVRDVIADYIDMTWHRLHTHAHIIAQPANDTVMRDAICDRLNAYAAACANVHAVYGCACAWCFGMLC